MTYLFAKSLYLVDICSSNTASCEHCIYMPVQKRVNVVSLRLLSLQCPPYKNRYLYDSSLASGNLNFGRVPTIFGIDMSTRVPKLFVQTIWFMLKI